MTKLDSLLIMFLIDLLWNDLTARHNFIFSGTLNKIECTCVLESDFGFIVNCNFKKSGLFRVRNLGGLKAHFGLGKCHLLYNLYDFSLHSL